MPTEMIDLYELHRDEYVCPEIPRMIRTRPGKYLAIAGEGEPGGEAFFLRMGALYSVAFSIKYELKDAGQDYMVAKLEALWWRDKAGGTPPRSGEEWRWKLLIRTPDFVTCEMLRSIRQTILHEGMPPEVGEVELEVIDEGLCVQMLHIGTFADEPEAVLAMKAYVEAEGYEFSGARHEIYLSDPRRAHEGRLRTILRHPVRSLN